MSNPFDWIRVPHCREMETYAEWFAAEMERVWGWGPSSSDVFGDPLVCGRGQWAFRWVLQARGLDYKESPIYESHGDSYDFDVPGIGKIDVKTGDLKRSLRIDRVEVLDRQRQKESQIDTYVFCKWVPSQRIVYILGWSWWAAYTNGMAELVQKGELYKGWEAKRTGWVCDIERLYPMASLWASTAAL